MFGEGPPSLAGPPQPSLGQAWGGEEAGRAQARWWQGWDLPAPSHRFLHVIALEFCIICGVAQVGEKGGEEPLHPKLDF